MDDISKSPERGTFQKKRYLEKLENNPDDQAASDMLEWYADIANEKTELIQDESWKKDNLEFDLRTTDWILEKVRADDIYAQHLYAAICNRDFTKNDVWPILTEKKWSCSWRYAGGIVADMRETGDYIDWYCTGIRDLAEIHAGDYQQLTIKQQEEHLKSRAYVSEGVVTNEIKEDLRKLGWIVLDDEIDI